ncbi:MAG TPA: alpha/beta hydrolase [Pseudomonadales bacterium]|jgi:pimeloyl-ACP methyl ester carboxylesterase|nr:alpha/beta hydrolase [Pseudomonadales bacterium]|tara:strand:- start:28 stop:891 length:864 start_codon:yes stop_codon:yes gene_type:complete
MKAVLDDVTGQYVSLPIGEESVRVYFEQAGQGTPLLCLHTAGADGRQFREIIRDESITANFQVIVPDMPWHGKSSPPEGWQEKEYLLTTENYLKFIIAFMAALELEQPLVMGCSIGGRVVLHLALRYEEKIGGIIGLQSGLDAGADEYHPETFSHFHRHDVHQGYSAAGWMAALIAPQSPDNHRWETLWHYASGGPGVFRGDIHYYSYDGDLRNQSLNIDTRKCPVYLLSGEYDWSAPAAGAEEIAQRIPGAYFKKMVGMGHFPMSENPEEFLKYLQPVLKDYLERK